MKNHLKIFCSSTTISIASQKRICPPPKYGETVQTSIQKVVFVVSLNYNKCHNSEELYMDNSKLTLLTNCKTRLV